jgi:hypothetical protein
MLSLLSVMDVMLCNLFASLFYIVLRSYKTWAVAYRGGRFKPPPPQNSKVLKRLSWIPSSVENTSVTTWSNWVEPLTRGLPPLDPCSVCPLSSTELIEPAWTWEMLFLYVHVYFCYINPSNVLPLSLMSEYKS